MYLLRSYRTYFLCRISVVFFNQTSPLSLSPCCFPPLIHLLVIYLIFLEREGLKCDASPAASSSLLLTALRLLLLGVKPGLSLYCRMFKVIYYMQDYTEHQGWGSERFS